MSCDPTKWLPILVCVSSIGLVGCHPGADSGRKGNKHFEDGLFEEATATYQKGIDKLLSGEEAEPRGSILSGLQNNSGTSQVETGNYAEARDNFMASVTTADDVEQKARGYYNAGFAAYGEEQKKLAADYLQRALLLEPDNGDAKYNFELIMRELQKDNEDQQNNSGGEPPPPPSAYAKELKAQAEELVEQRRYNDASRLMKDGLEVDPSVQAFQEFIDRIDSIVEIKDA